MSRKDTRTERQTGNVTFKNLKDMIKERDRGRDKYWK